MTSSKDYLTYLRKKLIIGKGTEKFIENPKESSYWMDRFRIILNLFGEKKLNEMTVLDAGCGWGGTTILFHMFKVKCYFFDIFFPCVKFTTLRLREQKFSNGEGLVADVTKLPFKNNSFDLVVCIEVLEHLGDDIVVKKAVNELIRVTKKFIFITVPNKLFPLEIHSKMIFGNYLPRFIQKKVI